MINIKQADFFQAAKERRAVKLFQPDFKLSTEQIEELLSIANQAPSAWNLQHWQFLVFTEQKLKEKLLPITFGQRQVVDASVVIAILGDLEANRNAEAVYAPAVGAGYLTEEIKNKLIDQINSTYANVPHAPRDGAILNSSLAAMQLMLAAKAMGLDSCPMIGYDVNQFIKEFKISSRYVPVMLLPIGKAAVPGRTSTRFPIENKIFWNSIDS